MRRILAAMLCIGFLILPVRGTEYAKYLAITFDDGPSGRFTRHLLDGLEQRQVKATFLLCGYRIRQYPQETERILRSGHEIGCHGFSHRSMEDMSRREIAAEIDDTLALLPEGAAVRFLRPPGGCCSDAVRQVAQAKNLAILSWSVDPKDWATDDLQRIEKAVLGSVSDGDILLFHDMSDSSVTAALELIDLLQGKGFRFTTVSELAALRGVSLRAGKTYTAFPRKKASWETFFPFFCPPGSAVFAPYETQAAQGSSLGSLAACQKSLAEFAARRRQRK